MIHLFRAGGLRSFCIFCDDDRLDMLPDEASAECEASAEAFERACKESYEHHMLYSSMPLWDQANDQENWRKVIAAAVKELMP